MLANDVNARSWFCVFNNPEKHGFIGSPEEIAEQMKDRWIADNPQRTCAVAFCVSADGLPHCHAVFEDTKTMRFTAVKKLFPGMHIEPTKGTKDQAEDYINKRGKWQEKGENIVCIIRHGDIKGAQGQRRDFEIIDDLIQQGLTPNEIMAKSFSYRRYSGMIRDAYYQKRVSETPLQREIKTYWHVGNSGSGKSYCILGLSEQYGSDSIYLLNDYEHGFDKYNGEPILFMDEFRGQLRYGALLNILDGYRVQVPCRYSNAYALWNQVHITSILPPELVYEKMVQENRYLDTMDQLFRRIDFVIYHYVLNGEYLTYEVPMSEYVDYAALRKLVDSAPEQQIIPAWCYSDTIEEL